MTVWNVGARNAISCSRFWSRTFLSVACHAISNVSASIDFAARHESIKQKERAPASGETSRESRHVEAAATAYLEEVVRGDLALQLRQ
eukprot:3720797-Rhodomonas_salina.2